MSPARWPRQTPDFMHSGTPTSNIGIVHDVVMNEREIMDQLNGYRCRDYCGRVAASSLCRQQATWMGEASFPRHHQMPSGFVKGTRMHYGQELLDGSRHQGALAFAVPSSFAMVFVILAPLLNCLIDQEAPGRFLPNGNWIPASIPSPRPS